MSSTLFKIIFIIGIILMIISLTKAYNDCKPPVTIYRYVPRTFVEDQDNPVPLDDIFYFMFNNPTPWVSSVDIERKKKDIQQNINQFYISQV